MKKTILLLFIVLFTCAMSAQDSTSDKSQHNMPTLQKGLNPINPGPLFIIVVDTVNIKVDHFEEDDIKPKWIEKMDVFTDANSRKIYGNDKGVVFIYIREKYYKKVLKELNDNDD